MSDLRPKGVKVEIFGQEREVLFTLDVIDEVQEKCNMPLYDVILKVAAAADGITDRETMDTYKKVVSVILSCDGPAQEYTEEEIGKATDYQSYRKTAAGILRAYGISMPDPDEEDDFEEDGEDNDTKAKTGR